MNLRPFRNNKCRLERTTSLEIPSCESENKTVVIDMGIQTDDREIIQKAQKVINELEQLLEEQSNELDAYKIKCGELKALNKELQVAKDSQATEIKELKARLSHLNNVNEAQALTVQRDY